MRIDITEQTALFKFEGVDNNTYQVTVFSGTVYVEHVEEGVTVVKYTIPARLVVELFPAIANYVSNFEGDK